METTNLDATGVCPNCDSAVTIALDTICFTCEHCGEVSALHQLMDEDEWIEYVVLLGTVDQWHFVTQ